MLLLIPAALAAPTLLSPEDGATVGSAVTFTVQTEQSATIHIRQAAGGAEPFRLVALPGTKRLVTDTTREKYGDLFAIQTDWIADNADDIAFVTHLGDLVLEWDSTTQWERADAAMSTLDGVVPYGVIMGNSDFPVQYPDKADQELFNTYFPPSRFSKEDWWGGSYPEGTSESSYQTFSVGALDFLILHLRFEPDAATRQWASDVLSNHPDHRAIIAIHSHLDADGELIDQDSYSAHDTWAELVEPHDSVFLILSAHLPGEAVRSDEVDGRTVHQVLSCYQDRPGDGEGVLRLLDFDPEDNLITVSTYNPATDTTEEDEDSAFTLDYPMSGFDVAGSGEPESGVVTVAWSAPGSGSYEWYAETADGQTTSLRTFTTDTAPPVISDIFASGLAETGIALVTWTTDERTMGEVLVNGLSAGQTETPGQKHEVELTGLDAEFALQILAEDAAGNVTESKTMWVTLGTKQDPGGDDTSTPPADDTAAGDTAADTGAQPPDPEGCGGCGTGAPGGGLFFLALLLPLRRARTRGSSSVR